MALMSILFKGDFLWSTVAGETGDPDGPGNEDATAANATPEGSSRSGVVRGCTGFRRRREDERGEPMPSRAGVPARRRRAAAATLWCHCGWERVRDGHGESGGSTVS